MTESVKTPERIWIESDGECPYFYCEEELSDVAPPITEYVRADKLQTEIKVLQEALEVMIEMVELNGFGRDYVLDVARNALRWSRNVNAKLENKA